MPLKKVNAEKLSWSRNFPSFMELESLSPYLQKPTCLYPQLDKICSQDHIACQFLRFVLILI